MTAAWSLAPTKRRRLGIGMGVPEFQIRPLLRAHHVQVFSSNYTLYGDMSQRVMETLEQFCPDLEVYSIDEAFLSLVGFERRNLDRVRATDSSHGEAMDGHSGIGRHRRDEDPREDRQSDRETDTGHGRSV